MQPRLTIERFDAFLSGKGLDLNAVVIRGAALSLLEVIERETRDFDIVDPALAEDVVVAARLFATASRERGVPLGDDWLNNGPISLSDILPAGWRDRLQPAFAGSAITLRTLGRGDLLRTKLFALCDRGTDLRDCIALAPSASELAAALPWVLEQDGNELWPDHVRRTITDLGERLGHGI